METEFRQIQQMFEHLQTNNGILHDKLNRFIGYNDTLTEVVKNMNGLVHTTAIAVAKNAILHDRMDTEIKNINVLVHTAVATNATMNAMAKFTEDMDKYMADPSEEVRGYQMVPSVYYYKQYNNYFCYLDAENNNRPIDVPIARPTFIPQPNA